MDAQPITDRPPRVLAGAGLRPGRRLKVLFFAEAVTLAHVARPVALARALDRARYEVVMACASRYAAFSQSPDWSSVELDSIAPEQFSQALANGSPLYDLDTLKRYVQADLALIQTHQPDLVVGDFRLSLSVSARLAKRPYLAIANAYWTPFSPPSFPLPVLPLTRLLPIPVARALFSVFRRLAFRQHCRPMNQLRALNGMPSLGADLRRVYTDADHLLVADDPALHPLVGSGQRFSFIGPLAWSPDLPWPEDATAGAGISTTPMVYVALGSSGPGAALALVLEALSALPVRVMAATAGKPSPASIPANASVFDYLPGDQAAARAALVVCNGGSLAVQQALVAGVPVLGVASNMDQFLNMAPVVTAGAGRLLRADRLTVDQVREACQALLRSADAAVAARALGAGMSALPDAASVFDAAAQRLLG